MKEILAVYRKRKTMTKLTQNWSKRPLKLMKQVYGSNGSWIDGDSEVSK